MTVSFLELRTYPDKSGEACATDSIKVSGVPTLPRPWSVTDTSTAENVALFAAVLVMMAYGLCNDPKLGVRSGISEKKILQCSVAQDVRLSSVVVFSADSMGSLQ